VPVARILGAQFSTLVATPDRTNPTHGTGVKKPPGVAPLIDINSADAPTSKWRIQGPD
jgi:hypothetical protein